MIAATHNGVFHSDDVFAAAALRLVFPEIEIIRTRDVARLAAADIRFDVGGVNGCGDFDHHQPGGAGERLNGIPFASFGLVWNCYGAVAVEAVDGPDAAEAVAAEVDRILVQQIDAGDNGVSLSTQTHPDALPVTISHAISWLNPSFNEAQDFDAQFVDAVDLASVVLRRAIVRAAAKVKSGAVLNAAIDAAKGGPVVVLPVFVPWQEALIATSALYVVYPSAGTWRVQGVPQAAGAFAMRRPLPAEWAGLEGDALASMTGVADAAFAHRGRFIAGALTEAGATELARIALDS